MGELYPSHEKQTRNLAETTGNRYKIEILMSRTQKLKGLSAASLRLKTLNDNPYAIGEWPAMKRVLECGDVELSNNLSEQMMRRIKMNLKNACNIGSEISAKHNAFMFSVIESCKMIKRNVEDYLKALFRRLRTAKEGEDLTCCLPCYMSF